MTGVQYALGSNGTRSGTQLGALRNGGFDQARIGASEVYRRLDRDVPSHEGPVRRRPENVTSAHLALPENGLTMPGIAWGNGANGSGDGPAAVDLSCASCHNPHGNGQYRILNPIPATTGVNAAWVKTLAEVGNDGIVPDIGATAYRTTESHGLLVGDVVTVAGNSSAAANVANATVATLVGTNGFTLTGVTPGSTATGGHASPGGSTERRQGHRRGPAAVQVTRATTRSSRPWRPRRPCWRARSGRPTRRQPATTSIAPCRGMPPPARTWMRRTACHSPSTTR